MDAVNFAQRHEQDVMVAETDHFGQGGAVVAGGFDAADFADGDQGAFGLDDQADQLDDAAVVAEHLGLFDAAEEVFEPVDRLDVGIGHHARRSLFKRSNLVSRRAIHGAEIGFAPGSRRGRLRGRRGSENPGPSAGVSKGEPAFCSNSRSAAVQADGEAGGAFDLGQRVAHGGFDHGGGNGQVGDEFLGDGQGEGDHGVFGVADDLGDGLAQGLEEALHQFVEFGALLEELFASALSRRRPDRAGSGPAIPPGGGLRRRAERPGRPERASRKGRGRAMVSDQEFIAIGVAEVVEVHFAGVFQMADGLDDAGFGGLDVAPGEAGRGRRFPRGRLRRRVWRRRKGGCS